MIIGMILLTLAVSAAASLLSFGALCNTREMLRRMDKSLTADLKSDKLKRREREVMRGLMDEECKRTAEERQRFQTNLKKQAL